MRKPFDNLRRAFFPPHKDDKGDERGGCDAGKADTVCSGIILANGSSGVPKTRSIRRRPLFWPAFLGVSRLWGWDWDRWGGPRDIDRERHYDQHPDGP